jgi:hypothetical protein
VELQELQKMGFGKVYIGKRRSIYLLKPHPTTLDEHNHVLKLCAIPLLTYTINYNNVSNMDDSSKHVCISHHHQRELLTDLITQESDDSDTNEYTLYHSTSQRNEHNYADDVAPKHKAKSCSNSQLITANEQNSATSSIDIDNLRLSGTVQSPVPSTSQAKDINFGSSSQCLETYVFSDDEDLLNVTITDDDQSTNLTPAQRSIKRLKLSKNISNIWRIKHTPNGV